MIKVYVVELFQDDGNSCDFVLNEVFFTVKSAEKFIKKNQDFFNEYGVKPKIIGSPLWFKSFKYKEN